LKEHLRLPHDQVAGNLPERQALHRCYRRGSALPITVEM
jgi:hypothetical protein